MADLQLFSGDDLQAFGTSVLTKVSVPRGDAEFLSETLVRAEKRAVRSHGLALLPPYAHRIRSKGWEAKSKLTIEKDEGATALIDGGNSLGAIVSAKAMEIAIEKARRYGTAFVGVRNSAHFGAAATFAEMATAADMIGFVFTGSSPAMAPWGGAEALVSNNPFAIGIPAQDEFPVILDMATSVVARGRIRLVAERGEQIPQGWALDSEGRETTDAAAGVAGFMMPIGGYKGYSIALIIDMLAGILTGAATGPRIRAPFDLVKKDQPTTEFLPQGVGHLFGAINVSHFMDATAFKQAVDARIRELRNSKRAPGVERIYVPGEREFLAERNANQSGVALTPELAAALQKLATEIGLEAPAPIRAGATRRRTPVGG